ncbi:MAG: hypothetical protein NTX05_08635 [Fusobacteria bacterium]|nr:hypothetical protein [Fusobacteriota bacterium]
MKVSTKIIGVAIALTLFAGCAVAKNPQATPQPSKAKASTSISGAALSSQASSITLLSKNQSGASVVTMTINNVQNVKNIKLNGLNNLAVIGQNIAENSQNGVGQVVATYYIAPTVGSYVLSASAVSNGQGITSNILNLSITSQDVTNFQNYQKSIQKSNQKQEKKMQQEYYQQLKEQEQLLKRMNQNMIQIQQQMLKQNQ